jgi:hypothetical protein
VILAWTPGFGAKLHYVYFGDNFDDVNNAAGGTSQVTESYSPDPLELDKDYYWRVDESDGVITYTGDVWTFKTLPDIPVTDPNLAAWWTLDEADGTTAVDRSGHNHHGTLMGDPQRVIGYDGGALEFDGRDDFVNISAPAAFDFGTDLTWDAWVKTASDGTVIARAPASGNWARGGKALFVRDGLLTVDVGWVGYVESTLAVDDDQWHHVAATTEFETTATDDTTTLYIDGRSAGSRNDWNVNEFGEGGLSVKIGFTNGNFPGSPWFNGQIDDVRAYNKVLTAAEIEQVMKGDPTLAWNPSPANGSTPDINGATPLTWSPGDNAAQHDVYFGTDKTAVEDADASDTTGVYRGRQTATSYTPPEGVAWGGGPYYWRIDEFNTDATISTGRIWSFTVADFLIVDDFESYNDIPATEPGSNLVYLTWQDGYDNPATNGSTIGYPTGASMETVTVHGGLQSVPYAYDNNFKSSQATRVLTSLRDWTQEGVTELSLWFYGDPANAPELMNVALNGTAPVYHDDPSAATIGDWTQWPIDLSTFGVPLTNVTSITIGFGIPGSTAAGGTGNMLFDDIRLIR